MPLYTYKCQICKDSKVKFRKIADRGRAVVCERTEFCGQMVRVIEAPFVVGDYPPYHCPVTGALIQGRKAHEANLQKHGARVLEPGETQAAMQARSREQVALEQRIGETVDREIAWLSGEQRDRLGAEMSQGLDVVIERRTGKAE